MIIKQHGISVDIELPDGTGNVARIIKRGRFYEQKLLDYIARLKVKGAYIDVGANIGNHCLFFALLSSAENVIALEPNPPIFDFLKRNVQNNKLTDKVLVRNVAAGAKKGKCSVQTDPTDMIGGTKVVKGNEIQQITLDEYKDRNITLVKVDVEGYEKNVLEGSLQMLTKQKPELFLELTTRQHFKEVYDLIKPLGYIPIASFNNSATYHFTTSTAKSPLSYHFTKPYLIRRTLRFS